MRRATRVKAAAVLWPLSTDREREREREFAADVIPMFLPTDGEVEQEGDVDGHGQCCGDGEQGARDTRTAVYSECIVWERSKDEHSQGAWLGYLAVDVARSLQHLMEQGRAAKDGFVHVCSLPVQAYNTKGESKWIREAKKISCIDGFKREKIIG